MTWANALAPRPLFFRDAPALIHWQLTAETTSVLKWIAIVLLAWLIVSLIFGLLVWPHIARYFFHDPTSLEEEAEALRQWEAREWFKKQQRRNKRDKSE